MPDRCDYCDRRHDRPSDPQCPNPHPWPDLAWRIVLRIESDLDDRRGLHLSTLDHEVGDELRDKWAAIIREELAREEDADV